MLRREIWRRGRGWGTFSLTRARARGRGGWWDNRRAELVGEKRLGEGAQQKTFELPDGAALILSVAKYESPSGKKLQDEGVTPGVLVASNVEQAAAVDEDAAAPAESHA